MCVCVLGAEMEESGRRNTVAWALLSSVDEPLQPMATETRPGSATGCVPEFLWCVIPRQKVRVAGWGGVPITMQPLRVQLYFSAKVTVPHTQLEGGGRGISLSRE